jgi:hypothetical protein
VERPAQNLTTPHRTTRRDLHAPIMRASSEQHSRPERPVRAHMVGLRGAYVVYVAQVLHSTTQVLVVGPNSEVAWQVPDAPLTDRC